MKTQQPIWKLVAQLGDAHPLDYGGFWVFEDTTGVYPPECERLDVPDCDDLDNDNAKRTVHRWICEPCTFTDGVLSDNSYHPDHPAWFADSIASIAESIGDTAESFIARIVSGTIEERAMCWEAIGNYHGFDNLDQYPLHLSKEECAERYSGAPYNGELVNETLTA